MLTDATIQVPQVKASHEVQEVRWVWLRLVLLRLCQSEDWIRHRDTCKKMDKKSCTFVMLSNVCFSLLTRGNHISGEDISNKSNRFPRKAATLQINRHWDEIVALARSNDIPLEDMAVRVDYNALPFQIHVFRLPKIYGRNEIPREPCLGRQRNSTSSQEGSVQKPDGRPPYGQPRSPIYRALGSRMAEECANVPPRGADDEETTYVDQEGNPFAFHNVDSLCAGVRLVRKYAAELGQSIWSEDILRKATEEVISILIKSLDTDDEEM